jgi:ribonuclease BN (tRNA processing enzyme)
MRIEDASGASLVYSGDTAATGHLAAIAAGADVLLCEATWGERDNGSNPPQMHLSGEEAGRAAAEAGVGRLMLTHIPPWGDPEGALRGARRFFDGPVELARPDLVVGVGR